MPCTGGPEPTRPADVCLPWATAARAGAGNTVRVGNA